MTACIFCEIIAGRAPVSQVYEDEHTLAFLDIRPVNPGHVLVIPKQHAANLAELPPEEAQFLFPAGQRVAAALYRSGLKCEGVNFFLADGPAAGQEVFHVHLHVFPRWRGDGFGLRFSPYYGTRPERAELDGVAAKIRSGLGEEREKR